MTMKSMFEQEEIIFNEWIEKAKSLGHDYNLSKDGLLFRGSLNCSNDDSCFWEMSKGHEEDLWKSAPKRLLIITKDLNNVNEKGEIEDGWDIRTETGLKNGKREYNYESCIPFYKRLRMWSYGLLNTTTDGRYPTFEEARNMDNSGPFYLQAPIVRINCKKQPGKGHISDNNLGSYLSDYKELLVR